MKKIILFTISIIMASSTLFGQGLTITNLQINDNSSVNLFAGDVFYISFDVVNHDNFAHQNCSITLSSNDNNLDILDSEENFDYIASGNQYHFHQGFAVQSSSSTPNEHICNFTITIRSDSSSRLMSYTCIIYSCHMQILDYQIFNNGLKDIISAAETDSLLFIIQNMSSRPIDNVRLSLRCNEPGVSILSGTNSFATINSDEIIHFNSIIQTNSQFSGRSFDIFIDVYVDDNLQSTYIIPIINFSNCLKFDDGMMPATFSNPLSTDGWHIDSTNSLSGAYSIRSGYITHYDTSRVDYNVTIANNSQISFSFQLETESNYDWFYFLIDGVIKDSWSGISDWRDASYPLVTGEHRLTWMYVKDKSVSAGRDCVWLDDICFSAQAFENPDLNASNEAIEITIRKDEQTTAQRTVTIENHSAEVPCIFHTLLLDNSNAMIGWAVVTPTSGCLNAQSQREITIDFNVLDYLPGDYTSNLDITFTGLETLIRIPVRLQVIAGSGISHTEASLVRLAPNPTSGNFKIFSEQPVQSLSIYDAFGRCLEQQVVADREPTFNISDFSNGIYFIEIATPQGKTTQKLIKQ